MWLYKRMSLFLVCLFSYEMPAPYYRVVQQKKKHTLREISRYGRMPKIAELNLGGGYRDVIL